MLDRPVWEQVETFSRDEMAALQVERLRRCVAHASVNVPLYRERLAAFGVGVGDMRSLEDLDRLPFTGEAGPAGQLSIRPVRRADE